MTYNANGGSGAPSSQEKLYGQSINLRTSVPTRSGYKFLGWSTSSSATAASYGAGASFSSNGDVTLYAVWEAGNTNYTVKHYIQELGSNTYILESEEIVVVFEKIRKILCEQLDLEEDDVTLESNIAEDLGGDSMDVVDLIMSIEDELAIEVPDDQVENIKTVGDIVNYIENVK